MASRMRRSVTSAVRTCPSTMCRRAVAKSVIAVLDLKEGLGEERLLCGNKPENASFASDCHEIVGGLWLLYRHGRSEPLFTIGDVAEWLRSGLQIRVRRFDSGRRLHKISDFCNTSPSLH